MLKKSFAVLVGSALISGSLLADVSATVDTTKAATSSPIKSILPGAYGRIELRSLQVQKDGEKDPAVQTRYYLGSKNFDDKLDTFFELGITKYSNTDTVVMRNPHLMSFFSVVDNDNAVFQPYFDAKLPHTDTRTGESNGTIANVGFYSELKYPMVSSFGKVTLKTTLDMTAIVGSRASNAVVTDRDGRPVSQQTNDRLGLNLTKNEKDGTFAAQQTTPSYYREFTYGVTYEPNKDLAFQVTPYFYDTYRPVMTVNENNRVVTESGKTVTGVAYTKEYEMETRIGAKYKFAEHYFVANDLYYGVKENGNRNYRNLLYISAELF